LKEVVKGSVLLSLEADGAAIQPFENIGLCSFVDCLEKLIKARNSLKELLTNVLTKNNGFLVVEGLV